jgi:hypothetical protein
VTQRDGVITSIGGEVPLRREKGEDDTNWTDVNLTGLKNKKNPRDLFNWYKWIVKI